MTVSKYIIFFLFIFSISFFQEQGLFAQTPLYFDIHGMVTGADTGMAWINFDTANYEKATFGRKSFVGRIVGGKFELNGSIPEPGRAEFYLDGWPYPAVFYLESGNFTIKVFKDSIGRAEVKGSGLSDIYNELMADQFTLGVASKSFDSIYNYAKNAKDFALMHDADSVWQRANQQWIAALGKSIANEPKNYVVLNMLPGLFFNNDETLGAAEELYNCLDIEVRNSPTGKFLGQSLQRFKKLAVGQPFPDFTASDIDGEQFSTASLRGHTVLVDFWSSFCGYCRAQTPNFLRAYQNFHAKGLEIVSFSEDTDPLKWKRAVQEDNMIWYNVSDLKGSTSNDAIAPFYSTVMPTIIIVDRNGIIASKGLEGEDLYEKLEQMVNTK